MSIIIFPRERNETMTASPLDQIVHDAARKLLTLRMTRIIYAADRADADNLRADLEALWTILDPVILAIGEYAAEHFHIAPNDIKDCFADQIRGALEGNATHVLDMAGERAMEDLYEDA